jgi:WD40 repeat protein
MAARPLAGVGFLTLVLASSALARAPFLPPGDPDPILQVEAGGPRGRINALAFGVTGATLNLYEAGFDKVVRVWAQEDGGFKLARTYRVPIGPESEGVINAMAVSADGRWLAVGGRSVRRDSLKFGAGGFVVPDVALTPDLLRDEGTIYVFDTQRGTFHGVLRGHRGPIVALAFARGKRGKPILVSAGRELVEDKLVKGKKQTALRVWDLDNPEEPLKQTLIDSDVWVDATSIPPGLAVYRSRDAGADPVSGLRVAVAFRNSKLYHWNVERNDLAAHADDRLYTETAVFGNDGALYTGGVITRGDEAGGKIDRWQLNEDGKLVRDRRIHVAGRHLPQALTFLPGDDDSRGKLAVVLQPSRVETHYRLAVVSLDTEKPETTFDLWSGKQAARQVAAGSRDGRLLAIADNVTPALRIWDTAAWKEVSRPLRSVGETVVQVSFARRGDHRGLRLRRLGGDDEEQVFDIDARRLLDGAGGWKDDGPDLEGWAVKDTPKLLTIVHDDAEVGRIHLGANQKPTASALLPARDGSPALLAVGYEERGVAYLALYSASKWKNVRPGQLVRLLVGHQGAIRSLAFDADGQALASAGDDQTVSVWSLKDLRDHLGVHGGLRGFRCMAQENTVRYLPPEDELLSDANREALRDLEGGSQIEELASGARKKAPRSMKDIGDILWSTKPGTAVTARVGGRAVELAADQGVDLRMPLFSLFFLQGAAGGQEWVGWSPAGSFDVGNRKGSEKYLAWHLNTGKANNPADAVSLDKERKEFYRPDILRFLLKNGDHDNAVDAWKNAPPRDPPGMTLLPTGPDIDWKQTDGERRVLLRKPPVGIEATLSGDFPLNRIARVLWQLDDEKPQPFAGTSAGELRAEFGRRDWKYGVHTLRLLVQLDNQAGTTYRSDDHGELFQFRYALPPPVAEVTSPIDGETERESVKVRYSFGPGGEGAGVRGHLRHIWSAGGARKEQLRELEKAEGEFKVDLVEGQNLLQLEVDNGPDSATSYPSGTTIKSLPLITRVPPASDVKIALTTIRSYGQDLKFPAPDEELVVAAPVIVLSGVAEAKDGLQEVTLDGKPLPGFEKGGERFTFDKVEVDLRGHRGKPQTLRVHAATRRGKEKSATLTVKYLPALPEFRLLGTPGKIDPHRAASHSLAGTFEQVEDQQPFTFRLYVNKVEVKRVDEAASLAQAARGVEARVKLAPGTNSIAYEVENQWRPHDPKAEPKPLPPLYVRRPPEVVELDAPEKTKTPSVDIKAWVRSARELPVTSAFVRVLSASDKTEDHQLSADDISYEKAKDRWLVDAGKVPFGRGARRIEVYASNGDGQSLEPAGKDISFIEPPPDKPGITIQLPARERLQTRPPYGLAFTVTTPPDGILEDVQVLLKGKEIANLRTLKHPRDGDATSYETEVPFEKGDNPVEIRARNPGGTQTLRKVFHVEAPPVALDPDSFRLEQYRTNGTGEVSREVIARLPSEQGKPIFKAADSGLVVFSGAFHWEENRPAVEKDAQVRVLVNGYEQYSGRLEDPVSSRRRFEFAMRLNRTKANQVQVLFPAALKIDPLEFTLDCAAPVLDQRLLLLVLAPGYAKPSRLRVDVAKGFLAEDVQPDGSFSKAPAFRRGLVLGPDDPEFNRLDVNYSLHQLQRLANQSAEKFREPTPEKTYNDVIVVYFRGEERVVGSKHYLMTEEALRAESAGDTEEMRRAAIDCNDLRDKLDTVKGAKLLLIDLQGRKYYDAAGNLDPVKNAGDARHVAVLQWGWVDPKKHPEENQLLPMWKKSLSQSELFRDVRHEVLAETQELLKDAKKGLTYADYVPSVHEDLVLGRKRAP